MKTKFKEGVHVVGLNVPMGLYVQIANAAKRDMRSVSRFILMAVADKLGSDELIKPLKYNPAGNDDAIPDLED